MNCACAYYDTAKRNLLLILLLLLRTELARYWQSFVHLNCPWVYYNTLLLHKLEKIKMAGSIRVLSSEMGDNHGNFDLFRLDSSVRIKTRIRIEVTDHASASSRLCLGFDLLWALSPVAHLPSHAPRHLIYYYKSILRNLPTLATIHNKQKFKF